MMCRARMYYRLLVLVICNVQAQERPTAVASIDPDTQVFVGETVTLTCDIEGGGDYQWWFSWYEEGSYRHVYSGQVYTISLVAEHHAGKYTCRGTFAGGSRYSHTSDAVTLTVSDKPKPTVRVSPQSSVYTGDTVTLSCEVQPSVGWKFLWYRNNTPFTKWTSVHGHTNTISEKMSTVGSFMYDCSATRGNYDTHYSNQVKITVTERPTAVVSIDPDSQVFDGETVTLTCDIKGGGATRWQYSWMKDSSVSPVSSAQVFTISDVTESHSDTYTCTVTKTTGSRYSHTSAAVTLTVSDKPRPTVSVSPQSSVYTGDTVTLSCEVQPSVRWRFLWYNYNAPLTKMTSVGDQTKTIIKTMSTVGSFIYKCRAERGNYYTHYSNQATITVTERPTAVVSIDPDQQVFVGETVTLTCDIKGGGDTKWQYSWMKEGSYRHVHNDQVYRISDVRKPHTGQYTCRGTEAGGSRNSLNSDAVTLTVSARPKAMASIDPDPQVFVGETVTLTCDIKGGGDTRWQYSWMKEESNRHVHSGQVYKISDVPKTNTGKYTCRGTFAGGSRYSHTSYAVTLTVSVKPKPELTSSLQGAALIGNPVTLYCKLEQSAGWRFYWSKHTQNPENETSTETSSTTISSVTPSDGGQYWCRAGRGNPVYYTHYSDALWVNVTVHPKAVVILIPDEQVFRGENVTLRCNIQGGDYNWTYRWFKDGSNLFSWDTSQTFNIRSVTEAYGGKYTCRGERSDSQSSDTSDARTLTVSKKPQAVLSMFPQSWLAEGDPVTLSCEVRGSSTGWTFSWYRDEHTLLSDSISGAGGSYTVSSAAVNHTGVYVCRAERGEPAYQTHYSNPQTLWVTGVSSIVSLIISPNRSQHFSGHSLSLSCEDQSHSTAWTVMKYKQSGTVSDCSSGGGSVTGSTCVYNFLSTSHTGVYWCQSESGVARSPVNITVHNGDVILDSPVHPVTEGDSLTLQCLCSQTPSNLTASFYKDGSPFQTQTTGQITIPAVSTSDEGLYYCKYPESRESPHSWISVRGVGVVSEVPVSVLRHLSSLLAASPYVLLSFILAVKYYRAQTTLDENRLYEITEAETSA